MNLELTDLKLSLQAKDAISKSDFKRITRILEFPAEKLKSLEQEDFIVFLERVIYLLWQSVSFSRKKVNQEDLQLIERVAWLVAEDEILGSSPNRGEWLCGETDNSMATTSRDMRVRHIRLMIKHILGEDCSNAISDIQKDFSNPLDLVEQLIDDDERCLSMGLILLREEKIRGNRSQPSFSSLYVAALFKAIDFDYEVLLDWLSSETVAISFLLELLRGLAADQIEDSRLADLKSASSEIQRFSIKRRKISTKKRRLYFEPARSDYLKIEIHEIIGSQIMSRAFQFDEQENTRYSLHDEMLVGDSSSGGDHDDAFQAIFRMLDSLRLTMQRLVNSQLAPFDMSPLVRWCNLAKLKYNEM